MAMSWRTQYNNLMFDIAFYHNTIGTIYSENTDGWNLRDAVSETQYTLEMFLDPDTIFFQDGHDPDQGSHRPWYKEWKNSVGRMKRFINRWRDDALKLHCAVNHSSDYDG